VNQERGIPGGVRILSGQEDGTRTMTRCDHISRREPTTKGSASQGAIAIAARVAGRAVRCAGRETDCGGFRVIVDTPFGLKAQKASRQLPTRQLQESLRAESMHLQITRSTGYDTMRTALTSHDGLAGVPFSVAVFVGLYLSTNRQPNNARTRSIDCIQKKALLQSEGDLRFSTSRCWFRPGCRVQARGTRP